MTGQLSLVSGAPLAPLGPDYHGVGEVPGQLGPVPGAPPGDHLPPLRPAPAQDRLQLPVPPVYRVGA